MTVKVLVLEDNPVARGFLCRVVRESFHDADPVFEASDLAGARRLDLELPDGNGLELLHELESYPATKIVTTLYSDDDHLFPALQAGADGYLLKEDRFEMLVQELQRIVRGQPPLSPAIARRLLAHFRETGRMVSASMSVAAEAVVEDLWSDCEKLTPRETEVLTYLSKGFTIKEIAGLMGIKWFTVNDHIKAVYRKLNVSSRAEAAVLATKHGLV
jgi:DNA-binding NarL/FixJ family response regulator